TRSRLPPSTVLSYPLAAPRYLHSFPTRRSSDLVSPDGLLRARLDEDNAGVLLEADYSVEPLVQAHFVRDREDWITYALGGTTPRSEEHTSELQSRENLVCRLLLEKKKKDTLADSTSNTIKITAYVSWYGSCKGAPSYDVRETEQMITCLRV